MNEYRGTYTMGYAVMGVSLEPDGDYVRWRWLDEEKEHHTKIYFSKAGNPYFRADGNTIYLSEVMRNEARNIFRES